MLPALVLARERAASLAEGLQHEIESAGSEMQLLELLQSRPVSGWQLCTGLAKLAQYPARSPDPAYAAATIVARPVFALVLGKLHQALPSLDSGYLREALCALAELQVCARSPAAALAPLPLALSL